MPRAHPTTMPATVPLLIPFELTDPWPNVGSAVADGVMTTVLGWPVTVSTVVMACVATGVGVGEGEGCSGLGDGEEDGGGV